MTTDNLSSPTTLSNTADTKPDGLSGQYFSGKFNWHASGSSSSNSIYGYGYFYGHVTNGDVVDSGQYSETILNGPASNYWYWNGLSEGNWSTDTNWTNDNGVAQTQAPQNNGFVILDGQSGSSVTQNTSSTVDQNFTLGALVLQNDYGPATQLGTGKFSGATLATGNYVDNGLGTSADKNSFIVSFASSTSALTIGGTNALQSSATSTDNMGNCYFQSGGSGVAITNDNVDLAEVGSLCWTEQALAVSSGARLYMGAWDDNHVYFPATLTLKNNSANFTISGSVILEDAGGTTEINAGVTSAQIQLVLEDASSSGPPMELIKHIARIQSPRLSRLPAGN